LGVISTADAAAAATAATTAGLTDAIALGVTSTTDAAAAATAATTAGLTDAVALGVISTADAAAATAAATTAGLTDAVALGVISTADAAAAATAATTAALTNASSLQILAAADVSLVGGLGVADVLQLSATHSNLDFSIYNSVGHQAITGFEVIDMSTDVTANSVTLTTSDLFHQSSNLVDVGASAMVVKGTALDTAHVIAGGFVMTGVANAFTETGAAGAGYSKYAGSFTDVSGFHVVELLIQNGVVVA